mgnify:CR=1 FL=1
MVLTFPEVVTPNNIEFLRKLVNNGMDQYPGANYVFKLSKRETGRRVLPIQLRYQKGAVELQYGDVVERHMLDGDIVLLNRQPTLHKQSMMGHRVKVINDTSLMTYRLSVAITTPYNADFDGDEMNVFFPQSLQTQIELEEIACVEKQIISPTSSKTVIGIVQDGLLGAYNLTDPKLKIDWRSAMNIMSYTSMESFKNLKKNKEYTGAELYSLILPQGINVVKGNFKIKNGQLIEGRLSKDMLGAKKKNNLVQLIWDGYGVDETKKFIDNTQRLINNFNLWHGFSVGIGDIIVPDEVHKQIEVKFQTKQLEVEQLITEIENNPDIMQSEVLEHKVFSNLTTIRDDASQLVVDNLLPNNNFGIMAWSGSKGDKTNMGQMVMCLGLQAFEGKLIPKKYNSRTFAYYFQNDDRAVSRGLVRQSFIKGLEFPEYVAHLMASRLGIIEQAIKTSETGYAQRKLIKSMEDIMIKYDGTVRSCNDRLIQIVYGDSGTDTTKQYEYSIKLMEYNNEDVRNRCVFTKDEIKGMKDFSSEENEKLYQTIIEQRDYVRRAVRNSKMNFIQEIKNFMLPVNLNRVIDNIAGTSMKGDILSPKYVVDKIDFILLNENTTLIYMSQEEKENPQSFKRRDEIAHKQVFKLALFDALSPKRMINELKLNKAQFDAIVLEIIASFNKNMIEPGEQAGIISGQSMGEPLTQMSVISSSMIIARNVITNDVYYGEVGKFIDEILEQNKDSVIQIPRHENSVLFDTDNYEILSVGQNEKTNWTKISQISKHPTNGDLIKISTKTGRTVTTTLSHSHLKRTMNGIVPILGSDLKIGDKIPIAKNIPEMSQPKQSIIIETTNVKLDYHFGRLCGIYLANGTSEHQKVKELCDKDLTQFLINNFGSSHDKKIANFVFGSNLQYISGLISGYFDTDGDIQCDVNKHIRAISTSKQLTHGLSMLCSYFGIYGSLLEERTTKYTFEIELKYANLFLDNISLITHEKLKTLKELANYNIDTDYDTIPELGNVLTKIEKILKLSQQPHKSSISRETLQKYIATFDNADKSNLSDEDLNIYTENIAILKQATNSHVIWDDIVEITQIKDPKEFVYDFTVPLNESFMIDAGVLVHNTLNSFHHAGIASMSATVQGVPRMKELLSVSKNPKTPQMVIYLTSEYMSSKDMAHKIASHIKYTTLGDTRGRINVYYDPNPTAKGGHMESDNIKNINFNSKHIQTDINALPWLMRIELDREKMLEKEVTLLEIKSKFLSWWEKRFNDTKVIKGEEKKVLNKINQLTILSNSDNDKQPVLHLRFNVKDGEKDKFNMNTVDNFIDLIVDKFKLKGLNSIIDIPAIQEERLLTINNETGNEDKLTQYVIYATGVNLLDIRYFNGVDLNKTITNNIMDVYETFGIEIARAVLLKEIMGAYSNAGGEVNYQHVTMIVDQMTAMGTINSIDRHGMNKSDSDPLARASFEKTVEQLLIASVYGETDYMRSVSSRIMAGAVVKGGTGFCEIEFDTDLVEKSENVEGIDYTKKFTELNEDSLAKDIIHKKDDDIFIPI